MTLIEQLQLSGLQAFVPLVLSLEDHKTEKAVAITLKIDLHLSEACQLDDLSRTLCFSQLSSKIRSCCSQLTCPTYVTDFSRDIIRMIDSLTATAPGASLTIDLPGSNSLSKEVSYKIERIGAELLETLVIDNIQVYAFLGCRDAERSQPQSVILRVEVTYPKIPQECLPKINTQSLILSIIRSVQKGIYNTMECLTNAIVSFIEERYCFIKVHVFLQKPHGAKGAFSSGVRIERATDHLGLLNRRFLQVDDACHPNIAYLSLGSNAEDGLSNIHQALHLLKRDKSVAIIDSSFLYRSKYDGSLPVKRVDFLNVAIKICTSYDPAELLGAVKNIELSLGKIKLEDSDDRKIDLDIIFYNNIVIETSSLAIPHSRMHRREWVLRPLADIDPFFIHPCYSVSVTYLLESLLRRQDYRIPAGLDSEDIPCLGVERVIQLGDSLYRWDAPGRPLIMGVLNATPDSFSDGGLHFDPEAAKKRALEMIDQGVDIIDIGGVSTRPGADEVEESVEYSRVIPVLETVREANRNIAISIDTTTPSVARECLKRGASFINTTLQTQETPEMYELVASSNVPIILMHSRGTPKTMASLVSDTRASNLLQDISKETKAILAEARRRGIYKWNIILDPGVGFAKTPEQNLDIISEYHKHYPFSAYPCLVGHSRKSFIQKLSLAPSGPKDCSHHPALWGTLASTSILCQNKTFIIRVHDIPENASIAKLHELVNGNK